MDPNATLEEMLEAIKKFDDAGDSDEALEAAGDLIEAFENLNEWLSKGGLLPERWKR